MDRLIGHTADLRGDDSTKPAHHFKQAGHADEDKGQSYRGSKGKGRYVSGHPGETLDQLPRDLQ